VRNRFGWGGALLALLLFCAPPVFAQPAGEAPAAATAEAAPSTLDELLTRLSQIQGLRARYVEEKRIALLKMPLRSEGTIAFAAPGLLVRRAEKPEPATLLLDGEVLWVEDASGKRRIDLGESAIVKHFVLTFVNVLRGDRTALTGAYALKFAATAAGWSLELTPKAPELRRFVARAVLEGHGATVDRMTLAEDNGDVTLMQFSAVDSKVRFDAEERARTFKLRAPASPSPRPARGTER
jgi:outer membrane lipoprotein-sorting protein